MCASSRRILLIITTLLLMLSSTWPVYADPKAPLIYTLDIDGMVTAGTAKYVKRVISTAEQSNAEAVIIKLNTPGGLVSATLTISQDMAASRVPVITYVAPQGAIAASAGTFILIGGNLAAMAPGTTCGAAMPVVMTAPGESSRQADEKTINFIVVIHKFCNNLICFCKAFKLV
jgi:membrane-bound serine protease (ClpP class)